MSPSLEKRDRLDGGSYHLLLLSSLPKTAEDLP